MGLLARGHGVMIAYGTDNAITNSGHHFLWVSIPSDDDVCFMHALKGTRLTEDSLVL